MGVGERARGHQRSTSLPEPKKPRKGARREGRRCVTPGGRCQRRAAPETAGGRSRRKNGKAARAGAVGKAVLMVAVARAGHARHAVNMKAVVPTGVMVLPSNSDRVSVIASRLFNPGWGHVVFRNPMSGCPLVKRVVAVGGQVLEIRNGYLYLDGVRQEEPYLAPERRGTYNWPEYRVPEGALWMMGDNRVESGDSRIFGPVPVSDVLGRAFLVYWPPAHMGRLR